MNAFYEVFGFVLAICAGVMILTEAGARLMIRADSIKMIEEVAETT